MTYYITFCALYNGIFLKIEKIENHYMEGFNALYGGFWKTFLCKVLKTCIERFEPLISYSVEGERKESIMEKSVFHFLFFILCAPVT